MDIKKTILVADDEPSIMKVVSFRLQKAGYDVTQASNGQEVLDLIKNRRPDIVLMDLSMPVMDGYEACRRIKSDDNFKNIPVLFFTASTAAINIEEKVRVFNADGYIKKPFEPEELFNKIKALLGK
jgi:CheY-like chemotaxis protein